LSILNSFNVAPPALFTYPSYWAGIASLYPYLYAMNERKRQKIADFDVNGIGVDNGNLFGLPFNYEESEVIVLPVPWEVTVSYSPGTAKGPAAMLAASTQVDLYDTDLPNAWQHGIFMLGISEEWSRRSKLLRAKAAEHIRLLEAGGSGSAEVLEEINEAGDALRKWVFEQFSEIMEQGKLPCLLGGDHSTPLGLIQALAMRHSEFGILQIDAHADLRNAYEGFKWSHASIMYNALSIPQINSLVQVGLRDVCEEEMDLIRNEKRIHAFFDQDLRDAQFEGATWQQVCRSIVEKLPQKVYISFDIDGLQPSLCPNTGTPVAGGMDVAQVQYLIKELLKDGKTIIGLDLVEVAPGDDEWDANVGVRLLYKLCNLMLKSNKK
jgi:agmatinase